jgi:hypothetical protein
MKKQTKDRKIGNVGQKNNPILNLYLGKSSRNARDLFEPYAEARYLKDELSSWLVYSHL